MCDTCHNRHYGPMIHFALWRKIAGTHCNIANALPRSPVLCRRCMEKRLRRRITFRDITVCRFNVRVLTEERRAHDATHLAIRLRSLHWHPQRA